MPSLLVIGGGLFGSQAAAHARSLGIEAHVFDAQLPGAASPAAAGLFKEAWFGKKLRRHFENGLPILEQLYGIRRVALRCADDSVETLLFVPPSTILERNPVRQAVTAVGDGWLEAAGERHEGWVYIAAGVWCERFCPGLVVHGKAGASFLFEGEREGRTCDIGPGRQAVRFVRDAGSTYFSDGTAEPAYTPEHDRQTLAQAAALDLTGEPWARRFGYRPYTPGGPIFRRLARRTWLATGGRKLGTVLGASFARTLVEELRSQK